MKMFPTDISVAKAILFNKGIPNPTDGQIAIECMRTIRNLMLKSSDWMATVDYPNPDKQAWLDYRQALRDLPETADPQLDENGQLTNITWPLSPEEQ